MSHQCTLGEKKANRVLGYIRKSTQMVKGGVPSSLISPGEKVSLVLCPVLGLDWASHYKNAMDLLEQVQDGAMKIIREYLYIRRCCESWD